MALPASYFNNAGMASVRRRETADGLTNLGQKIEYLHRSGDVTENEYCEAAGLIEELLAIFDNGDDWYEDDEDTPVREPGE